MKRLLVILALLTPAMAQINTTCNTSGTITNCQTNDNGYSSGYAMGQGIGNLGVALAQRHAVKKQADFCFKNSDQSYHGTSCTAYGTQVAARWINAHPKFHQSAANGNALAGYMQAHNLSPFEYRSYDKAFKALKRDGRVELNR